MSNSSTKLRKIYKRNSIVHVCFAGAFYAPEDSETTEILPGAMVKTSPLGELEEGVQAESLAVFQPRKGKKGLRETWVLTVIPRGAKRAPRKSS